METVNTTFEVQCQSCGSLTDVVLIDDSNGLKEDDYTCVSTYAYYCPACGWSLRAHRLEE